MSMHTPRHESETRTHRSRLSSASIVVTLIATLSLLLNGFVIVNPAAAETTDSTTVTVVDDSAAVEVPASEPQQEPAAPESEPAQEPAAEPATPAEEPASEPAAEPAEEAPSTPVEDPAAAPADEPAEVPDPAPADEPAEPAEEQPTDQPIAPVPDPVLLSPADEAAAEPDAVLASVAVSVAAPTYLPAGNVILSTSDWTGDESLRIVVTTGPDQTVIHEEARAVPEDGVIVHSFAMPTAYVPSIVITATGTETGRSASIGMDAAKLDPVTIESDKPDYQPGSRVELAGTGWTGDETVHVVVNDTLGQTWRRSVDIPVGAEGRVLDVFYLPTYFVSDYDVKVTGRDTARVATTTFTDAVLPADVQALNWETKNGGAWVTATLAQNNSDYSEGEVVPFMIDMKSLPSEFNPYYAPICRDFLTSDVYGYTRLDTFDTDRAAELPAGTRDDMFPFTGVGIDLLQIAEIGASAGSLDGNAFDCQSPTQRLTIVKFNSLGTGNPYLLWGGYLAAPGDTNPDVPYGQSAGYYSGGSLQMRLASPDKTSGINPSAVIRLAKLTVTKVVDSGTASPDQWCFTVTGPDGIPVQRCIATGQNSVEFLGLATGAYAVTESNVPGYSFASGSGTYCTFVGSTATADVIARAGVEPQNASCTFHNAQNLGSLELVKALTGGPAGYTGPFTIEYVCRIGDVVTKSGSETVAAGSSKTVSGIPTGSTCVVSEPTLPAAPTGYSFGTPTFTPANATVTVSTQGQTVTVTTNNALTRDLGSLRIAKTLSAGGSGYDAPFAIDYVCRIGDVVTKSGQVSVPAGQSRTVSGIPTGSVCTVSEELPGAVTGYTWSVPVVTGSPTAAITKDATVDVSVANALTRDLGSLRIAKTLSAGGSGYDAPFAIDYVCRIGDVVTKSGQVSVPAGQSRTVSGIPTGSVCTVSEELPGAVTGYTWSVPVVTGSPTAAITKDATVDVGVANALTRDLGSLRIAKTLSAGGSGYDAPFAIDYVCRIGDVVTKSGQVSVPAGQSRTVSGIPTGSVCTVSEELPGAVTGYTWSVPVVTGSPTAAITKDATVDVGVANALTRDLGSLRIAKTLSAGGSGYDAPFAIDYVCRIGDVVTKSGQVSVPAGQSRTVSGIPTGSVCTVSEELPGAVTGYTWSVPVVTGSPTAAIAKDATVDVGVANALTRDLGSLRIAKTLSAGGSGYDAPFAIDYVCRIGDVVTKSGQVSVPAGQSRTVSGIPTGSVCTVSEELPGAVTGYTWSVPVVTGSPTAAIAKNATVDVGVANALTRDLGSLRIAKTLSDGGSGYDAPFAIDYVCRIGDVVTKSGQVSVPAGQSRTVSGIPTGSVCTVSEELPGAVTGYTWSVPVVTGSPTAAIAKNATVDVGVANALTRDLGSLRIAKTLSAGGSGYDAPFAIDYVCRIGDVVTKSGQVSVPAGQSRTVSGIPTGSVCTVSEELPGAVTGYTWSVPVVTGSPTAAIAKNATVDVGVANALTRDLGSLRIAKTLSAGGSGYDAPFAIDYVCRIGDVVTKSGQVSVPAGQSRTVSGIPTGSVCTVSEELPGAVTGYTWSVPVVTGSPTAAIAKNATVDVGVANALTRDLGSLRIAKTLSAGGSGYDAPFAIDYVCRIGDVVTKSGQVSVPAGQSRTVSGIPTGSVCTVSEELPGAVTGYTWSVPVVTGSPTAAIAKNATVDVGVANALTRDLGSLRIAKTLSDGGSGYDAPFAIDYVCRIGDVVTKSGQVSVPAGQSRTVSGIPTGSVCTVSEELPGAVTGYTWSVPVVTGSPTAAIAKNATVDVGVANALTRDLGSLRIAKTLSGGPSAYTGLFTIAYNCGPDHTGTVELAAGESATVSGIPTGTRCVVSEPTLPAAPSGYAFGTPTFDPSDTVTITEKGVVVTVTTRNTLNEQRTDGALILAKTLNGGPADYAGPFTIAYNCGGGINGSVPVTAGGSMTVWNIPKGSTCVVSEPNLPTAPEGYTFGTPTFQPADATVTITAAGQRVTVTTNNTLTELPVDVVIEPPEAIVVETPETIEVAPVPATETIPTGVPAGDGSSTPAPGIPLWGLALIVVALSSAVGAVTRVVTSRGR